MNGEATRYIFDFQEKNFGVLPQKTASEQGKRGYFHMKQEAFYARGRTIK